MDAGLMEKTIDLRLQDVRGRIAAAAARAGRDPEGVKLVVVSKGQPDDMVRAAVSVGVRRLGENYPEEGQARQNDVDPGGQVEWHMIGGVQSRKAALVADHFAVLHSLDRVKLARRLQNALEASGKVLPALVQINIGEEPSKSGLPASGPDHWAVVADFIRQVLPFDRLQIRGLMCIPPFMEDPQDARPFFRKTRQLRETLADRFPTLDLDELSMGMSGDYEVAVEEGATLVRIGTAVFGPRPG